MALHVHHTLHEQDDLVTESEEVLKLALGSLVS